MYEIGMMQGRLTPPKGRGIQFFPFDNWEQEFFAAQKLGAASIEFIFDLEHYQENPLWTAAGIARINELQKQTGVRVDCLCLDYFMRKPFYPHTKRNNIVSPAESEAALRSGVGVYRADQATYRENIEMLKTLIVKAKAVGAFTVEIPILDNASLKTDVEQKLFVDAIQAALPTAQANGIIIGIEADLPPQKMRALLDEINHPLVQAVYDSGNSASLGFDSYEEVTTLQGRISSIQIKDRVLGGTTVDLGMGNADFEKLFRGLKEIGYRGNFILQSARGIEGQEAENIKKHLAFVQKYIDTYLI